MSKGREITTFDEIGKKIRRESDASVVDQMGIMSTTRISSSSSSSFGVPHQGMTMMSTTTLNTITPCAACKLLRRRCAEECPFSPYFSPHEPQKFSAVHKVFGASNVSKMLLEVAENQRADAANSLVYEANLRLRDPVYGCMGVISALQQQIQSLQAELNAVRTQILRYKFKEATSPSIVSPRGIIHHAALVSNSGMVSIAAQPQAISPPPPPPPPLPPASAPSSVVFSSSSSSSASSLYNPSTNTTGYSSISSKNVPYFD
ncbi:LOB domain-containing protein 15-like [Malus sylvestris]|uniref:LOB domain-containing protein 15-like n=1 Tax=Malus sylvestris TaxID=3752 RepID=UPI0021AC5B82|nr:LOB domain-containing protein 15-like [Malus sylvestris]